MRVSHEQTKGTRRYAREPVRDLLFEFVDLERTEVGEVGAAGAKVVAEGGREGESGTGARVGVGGASSVCNAGSEPRRLILELARLSLNKWTILENRRRRPRRSGVGAWDESADASKAADSAEAADSDESVLMSVDARELLDW
jgi:hypothetical protein